MRIVKNGLFGLWSFVLFAVLLIPVQAFAEIDVIDKIGITVERYVSDRHTGSSIADIKITNISAEPIQGPIKLVPFFNVLDVVVANADGRTDDQLDYKLYGESQGLIDDILEPSQTSQTVRWVISNPERRRFTYNLMALVPEFDSDGDGFSDHLDGCPTDPNKIVVGICGCGQADDANQDGYADCGDQCQIWYRDADADGYGSPLDTLASCTGQPEGYVANPDDCNDSHWSVNPTFGERCDEIDNDCNGSVDNSCFSSACSTVELDVALPCVNNCDGNISCMASCTAGLSPDCLFKLSGLVNCLLPANCLTDGTIDQTCAAENCLDDWHSALGGMVLPGTDLCPTDTEKTEPGICGCGLVDEDLNQDGVTDCLDKCPNDPNKITPGDCGCGVVDVDTDNDGTADCIDQCPHDPLKSAPGACGCGLVDDLNQDGQIDCSPDCPIWYADQDGDGYGDAENYISYCLQVEGYVANPDDCNDSLWSVNPLVGEVCNDGIDNDCDGQFDDDNCFDRACSSTEVDALIPCITECAGDTDCAIQCSSGLSQECIEATTELITCSNNNGCTAAGLDVNCMDEYCGDELELVVGPILINDGSDHCPSDPDKMEPGVCGCGLPDEDTDGDETFDCFDNCPEDAAKVEPGTCGCGIADLDTDNDGLADCVDPDMDNDGYLNEEDCEPTNPLVNPATNEICDGLDNNCDGQVDGDDCLDMDCTNSEIAAVQACAEGCGNDGGCLYACLPSEFSQSCLLTGASLVQCMISNSCGTMADPDIGCVQESCSSLWFDVFGESPTECQAGEIRSCGTDVGICQSGTEICTASGLWSGTCDGEVAPEPRTCNGLDNDCDGEIDIDADIYQLCVDYDGDGYIGVCTNECTPPGDDWEQYYDGIITDCDRENPEINPAAVEICDGEDNNCNGVRDEGFADMDGDGYADCVDEDIDGDGYENADDCDPLDPQIGQPDLDGDQIPDCFDDDVDGDGSRNDYDCAPDNPDYWWGQEEWMLDADGDGYSPNSKEEIIVSCLPPTADHVFYVRFYTSADCNDSDPDIHNGAGEYCDGIDNNCNGQTDEYYLDSDGDGLADCVDDDIDGDGFANDQDCQPKDPLINPGVREICDDGIDNNCNGMFDNDDPACQ